MELGGVVDSTLTQLSNSRPGGNDMGIAVLKTSLATQAQSTQQLLSSVPKPEEPKGSNPPHLGNNIDVKA